MSTIYIIWLRQLKRYYRSKARIVGAMGQPFLYLVALGFGFGPVFEKAGEGSYIQFLTPGIIAMSTLFTALFTGIEIIWDRQFGFLKETLVAPVSRMEIMIGKTLGGATVATISGVIVFIISFMAGFRLESFIYLPFGIFFLVLIAILFTAIGTAIASLLKNMHAFQLIMNFIVMPIFFLSGAIFLVNDIPKALSVIVRINPLSYGVDGLRAALNSGNSFFGFGTDILILSLFVLGFLAIGSYLFSKIEI